MKPAMSPSDPAEQMKVELEDEAATEAFGRRIAAELRAGDVVALYGTLGAGKTTLARGVLEGLGYRGDVASPTFPIVIAYEPPQVALPVRHVDLYRIERPDELEELGIEEALDEGALLIEWPERLGRLWPGTLRLTLAVAGDGRIVEVDAPVGWQARIARAAAGA
jgi:tRNA threonylcarbamoyladenosine biosynthesis protein TsaE